MAETLSDYNVNEFIATNRSQVVSKRRSFSDLDLSLELNPNFNDIVPLTDIDAVKNSVRNLILTNFFERPFQPWIGSNLSALLFEPADSFTIISIREEIKKVLRKYEPRVDDVTVEVKDQSDRNSYTVTVGFRVISVDEQVDITLYLKRIR
jgi:phage baseplate assembly protein W